MSNYTHIVVGAGSAGCALAARLSEDASVRVLLLEAGGSDQKLAIRMPIMWHPASESEKFGWGFSTEPEQGIGGRSVNQPRGKLLGGCSSINGMMYSRGNRRDYDRWADSGLDGWAYEDVLPYFKRSESSWRGEGPFHGETGPFTVSPNPKEPGVYEAIIKTAQTFGYSENTDFNAEEQEGFGVPDFNVRNGRRESASTAYLGNAKNRSNLTIETKAQVLSLVLDGATVKGVDYMQHGVRHTVQAEEVILCGGAFNSPQLLLLSGIGPAAELAALGIKPIVDLPYVGKNLQDHPLVPVGFKAAKPMTFEKMLRLDNLFKAAVSWFVSGKGPLGASPMSAQAYIRTQEASDYPDTQLQISHVSFAAKPWFPGLIKRAGDQFTVTSLQLRPFGRGSVTLKSADPLAAPAIRLGLLEDVRDKEAARTMFKFVRRFFATAPFSEYVAEELFPGPSLQRDEEIDAYIQQAIFTGMHPAGTCAMGVDPATSVVDGNLKVHGVSGLRVCDASVMPTIVSGNTSAPVIMIAEKAADMILGKPALKS